GTVEIGDRKPFRQGKDEDDILTGAGGVDFRLTVVIDDLQRADVGEAGVAEDERFGLRSHDHRGEYLHRPVAEARRNLAVGGDADGREIGGRKDLGGGAGY